MSKLKGKFAAEFKTRVAMNAQPVEQTLSELASKYGVHSNQNSQWKHQDKEQIGRFCR